MKKVIASVMKKMGEKIATVPIEVRSFPFMMNQPKMPTSLIEKWKIKTKNTCYKIPLFSVFQRLSLPPLLLTPLFKILEVSTFSSTELTISIRIFVVRV